MELGYLFFFAMLCHLTFMPLSGKKGQFVWTSGRDEEHLSRGVYNTYTTKNLRYSQVSVSVCACTFHHRYVDVFVCM